MKIVHAIIITLLAAILLCMMMIIEGSKYEMANQKSLLINDSLLLDRLDSLEETIIMF